MYLCFIFFLNTQRVQGFEVCPESEQEPAFLIVMMSWHGKAFCPISEDFIWHQAISSNNFDQDMWCHVTLPRANELIFSHA